MKKFQPIIVLVALIVASCGGTGLEKGDWSKKNYKAIDAVIQQYGSSSDSYDPEVKPYAVFDFDNTTIMGDISMSTVAYQIENLRYRLDPESIYFTFTNCVPNIDCSLDGFDGVSARMLATDLQNDYAWLFNNYIKDQKLSLKEIHKSEQFLDFRAKIWALSSGADNTFGYETGCLWITRMFAGLSYEELEALAREAAAQDLQMNKFKEEVWTSPNIGEAGEVSVTVPRGMRVRKELLNLYETLQTNGFDVYVCTASEEHLVEGVACEGEGTMGFELSRDQVYGIRVNSPVRISPNASYAQGYPHTHHEGKSELIRSVLAPSHGGHGPAIVAGDSNGDANMLVDFADMKLGIIFDLPRTGAIADLKTDKSGRYIVQKWK